MVERRIREARFPAVKSLDSFDFAAIPALNKMLVLELARGAYLERRENVIALGPSGTGKTHVALGLGLAACQKGLAVGFVTAAALVHELLEARDERRLLRLHKQLAGHKLLIVDELGYVPLSPSGAELLFEVFSRRYERGSILVTSNLPFDEWTCVFGAERLTGALARPAHPPRPLLEMNGESYRLQPAGVGCKRRRQKRPASQPPPDPSRQQKPCNLQAAPGWYTLPLPRRYKLSLPFTACATACAIMAWASSAGKAAPEPVIPTQYSTWGYQRHLGGFPAVLEERFGQAACSPPRPAGLRTIGVKGRRMAAAAFGIAADHLAGPRSAPRWTRAGTAAITETTQLAMSRRCGTPGGTALAAPTAPRHLSGSISSSLSLVQCVPGIGAQRRV